MSILKKKRKRLRNINAKMKSKKMIRLERRRMRISVRMKKYFWKEKCARRRVKGSELQYDKRTGRV